MKFLVDVCASSRALQEYLRNAGHDLLSVYDVDPKASDEDLLSLAASEERVLITEDRDFGELVFVRGLPHPTIVRLVELRIEDQVAAVEELIDKHADDLSQRAIIVVSPGRIRVRRTTDSE